MLAAEFPLEPGNRLDRRVGTQTRQAVCVARACALRLDRRGRWGLGLRPCLRTGLRRLADRFGRGCAVDRRSRRRRGRDTFEQALDLQMQPIAGELPLEASDLVRHRVGAQPRQPLFVAAAGERRIVPLECGLRARLRRLGGSGFAGSGFAGTALPMVGAGFSTRFGCAGGIAASGRLGGSRAATAGGTGMGSIFFGASAAPAE